ncbi:MAG: Asp-tRNA(Asn)/Glu-tRNA(Gln) amidotransferase subunit GatB, partial [Chloroflexi bacterium]|nr:Asp-tRNA(Asn)/Glu-tRNA(Gln) amidotransferase subunit GatB [Chloroflexota bacterium]
RMEVVGEPDLRSGEEARLYLVKLRTILQYLGVSTGNMEEGSFRCDANISIRPVGSDELNVKVEVKNMNSFRAVYRALNYELERQIRALNEGERIVQETRGWVEAKGITVSQRSKEYANDYRFFPEPDLPPMVIDRAWVKEIRDRLPELPDARLARFISQYGLAPNDAVVLVNSKPMADFFEECVSLTGDSPKVEPGQRARAVGTWMLGDFSRLLNAQGMEIRESKVSAEALSEMLGLIDNKTLSGKMAKGVFEEMFDTGQSPGRIVKEKGLLQMTDSTEISGAVAQALESNPDAVSDFLSGKEQALTFLVGQVMKATRGRANPAMVNSLLRKQLESRK